MVGARVEYRCDFFVSRADAMMCGGPDGTPTYALTLTLIGMQEEGPMIVMWLYKLLACELIGRYEDLKADRLRISATVRMA